MRKQKSDAVVPDVATDAAALDETQETLTELAEPLMANGDNTTKREAATSAGTETGMTTATSAAAAR